MSLLSAYFDASCVSFLIKKDKKNIEMLNFPYVYSKGILSNQCSEQEFYESVIKKILSDRKIKIDSCDILTSGLIDPPSLSFKVKFSVGVADLIQNSEEFIPVVAGNFSFLTKNLISSFSHCNGGDVAGSNGNESEQLNYYSNICIYPQIVSDDISNQSDIDEKILEKIPANFKIDPGKIVFTGGRFAQNTVSKELTYILILEMLKGYGAYDVYLDQDNAFLLSQTLKIYDKDVSFSVEDYIEQSGLFIRTGGAAECLLSTGVGDDQFIEIEKEKIFVMPLKLDESAKLSVKSSGLGTINLKTKGGEVGIVFDTRTENKDIYKDVKLFNDCIKQFGRSRK